MQACHSWLRSCLLDLTLPSLFVNRTRLLHFLDAQADRLGTNLQPRYSDASGSIGHDLPGRRDKFPTHGRAWRDLQLLQSAQTDVYSRFGRDCELCLEFRGLDKE